MKRSMRFFIGLALLSPMAAQAGSLPKLGIAVPQYLAESAQNIEISVYDNEVDGAELVYTQTLSFLSDSLDPQSRDYEKYIAPYASEGDIGFIFNGQWFWTPGNLIEICLVDEAGHVIDLRNGNISSCYHLHARSSIEVQAEKGYGRPTGNQVIPYGSSNPGINLGWKADPS